MATTRTETALDRFIADMHELFERESDLDKRWEAVPQLLGKMLADPQVIDASKRWPETIVSDRAQNLLFYVDPEYGFAINSTKSRPHKGPRTPHPTHPDWQGIHDHAHIYTAYGVLTGHQIIERYDRGEDRSDEGYVEIIRTKEDKVEPGVIDLVRPYEIHAERSVGEECIAVIVRSEKSGGFLQGRYTADTGEYWQGYGPRQIETNMLGS